MGGYSNHGDTTCAGTDSAGWFVDDARECFLRVLHYKYEAVTVVDPLEAALGLRWVECGLVHRNEL